MKQKQKPEEVSAEQILEEKPVEPKRKEPVGWVGWKDVPTFLKIKALADAGLVKSVSMFCKDAVLAHLKLYEASPIELIRAKRKKERDAALALGISPEDVNRLYPEV